MVVGPQNVLNRGGMKVQRSYNSTEVNGNRTEGIQQGSTHIKPNIRVGQENGKEWE
jgi:hypothetical protein